MESKGTQVNIILSDEDIEDKWGAWVKSTRGDVTCLEIMTPPDVYVGKWSFKLDVVKRSDTKKYVFRYEQHHPVYILFNPWCKSKVLL